MLSLQDAFSTLKVSASNKLQQYFLDFRKVRRASADLFYFLFPGIIPGFMEITPKASAAR
jgi:hypothetical protein